MQFHTTTRRLAPLAAIAAGALALAACGSSSSTASGGASSSAAPASAAASTDMVTAITGITDAPDQTTGVTLDAGTVKALNGLGVALAPTGTAKVTNGEILFPITSGYAEIHSDHSTKPGYIEGSLQHDTSGFSLTAGKTVVTLSNFVVDPGGSMLYGTVDGTTAGVPLLNLNGSAVKVSMDGSTVHLDGTVASLTATAASALDKAFSTTAVTPGLVLGVAHISIDASKAVTYANTPGAVTTIPLLKGTSTAVTLDAGTVKALTSLKVSVAPSGTAKVANGVATFPITGGFAAIHKDTSFKPGYIVGSINHEGSGLTLSGGGKSLTVEDFAVDPGNSILTAYVPALKATVPLLTLDGTNVKVSMSDGNVVLDGTVAKLTATAATALDSFFGTKAITAGLPLGVVHLIATPA